MKISQIITESHAICPECGGPAYSDSMLAEKKDACYHKVKASAKVWPSAYASGRLVQCRKKGAANYGNKSEGVAEGKITLSTDPNWYGATVDNYQASGPVVNIPANQLVGFEPDDKMNQPKSKVNVEKIVAGLKQGAKLPPLLVRKYKNGYQVLDGHHRFWAYKLLGVKSIPAQIVPDSDIEEISKQGVAEDNLKEFAPGSGGGESGRWYTDDQMTDLVGDGWWNDLDISGDISKQEMIQEAQAWLDDQGYSVHVLNCKVNDDDMEWFIEGSFQNSGFANKGVAEGLTEEFDLIESIIEGIAAQNGVDVEAVWADLESLTEDELYAFAVTSQLNEDWQKANKRDKTDGMSQKAVNAYRRENPGSKLKTAVTTKPSKLKKGGKASKRRKSYCSRSRGQMKMHSISCAKTPDKAICKARRRWNC